MYSHIKKKLKSAYNIRAAPWLYHLHSQRYTIQFNFRYIYRHYRWMKIT